MSTGLVLGIEWPETHPPAQYSHVAVLASAVDVGWLAGGVAAGVGLQEAGGEHRER